MRPTLSLIPWPADLTLGQDQYVGDRTVTIQDADPSLGDEGYQLEVTPSQIVMHAPKPAGLYYGTQTVRQILANPAVPSLRIRDEPRFGWRGFMLDEARHFFGKEFVKGFIDLLALHKLNVFHWHLTDDQGWRIEIEKYPRLTAAGPFYTQNDIREVVAYAASRFVTVVPEIEMPGHCTAALAAYPQLSCSGGPFEVATRWGVFEDVYCAGNDETFEFLEGVLGEVLALFPSEFIHIGGDECPKTRWRACAKCQAHIRTEGLRDEDELQSYFIRRIERFLHARDRRLVGWDEILEGSLAPHATVMSWRGMNGAIAAARAGHDAIATPNTHCYLDYSHEKISLEKVYSFEPIPSELAAEHHNHILGVQANMWTELTPTPADVERQVWPRLCALAEVAWSPTERHDFADFSARLTAHRHQPFAVPQRR